MMMGAHTKVGVPSPAYGEVGPMCLAEPRWSCFPGVVRRCRCRPGRSASMHGEARQEHDE